MKKLATFAALAAFAISAYAATITWGFGGVCYISEDGSTATISTSSTADMRGWSIALIYVGQNKSSFDIDDVSSSSIVKDGQTSENATIAYDVETTGKNVGKWKTSATATKTTSYNDGASFAVVWWDGASTFDYIYAGTTSVGAAVKSTLTVSDMSETGGNATVFYATGGSGKSGVVVVPEPSVALLGLLGIGMLIKRRRA